MTSYILDFLIIIFGIIIMFIIRSFNYLKRTIRLYSSIDFENIKQSKKLILPNNSKVYELNETLSFNDISDINILLKNADNFLNFGNYFSTNSKKIRDIITTKINSDLSVIYKNFTCNNTTVNNKLIKLYYCDNNTNILILNNEIFCSKLLNCDELGSLLLWNCTFSDPNIIYILNK
ncbi:MAG: hypothetical protein ACP5M9_01795 [Candidatus Micrarchaeia archaeon]